MSKNERNFWLDGTLFLAYLITAVSGVLLWLVIPRGSTSLFAGIGRAEWLAMHEGSGLLGLMGVILHIVWHWDWLKALRGRSMKTLKKSVRANRVIDRIVWFSFICANVFGLLAWLLPARLPGEAVSIVDRLHVATSILWLVCLAAHLVLHQKWIVSAVHRYLPLGGSTQKNANMEAKL